MDEKKPDLLAFIEATYGKLPAWQHEMVRWMEKNPDREIIINAPRRLGWSWLRKQLKQESNDA